MAEGQRLSFRYHGKIGGIKLSLDFNVFLDHSEDFSLEDFVNFCKSIDFVVEAYPEFDFYNHTGFLPFKLFGNFLGEKIGNQWFLSGFEFYCEKNENEHSKHGKKGFFKTFFNKKEKVSESSLETAINNKNFSILMMCSSQDSFEELTTYLFTAYLCKSCNGIFYDAFSGQYISDFSVIESKIIQLVAELKDCHRNKQLLTHRFIKW